MIWTQQTSASPERWSEERPATGQCAVTSLLLQDLFGGTLERVMVDDGDGTESHYFNLVDGTWIDATASQFTEAAEQIGPIEGRSREYVLSFEPTRERYRKLLLAANTTIVDRLFELEGHPRV